VVELEEAFSIFLVYPQCRTIRHIFIDNWIERISTIIEKLLARFSDITTVSGIVDDELKPFWNRGDKSIGLQQAAVCRRISQSFPAKLSRTKRDRNLLRDCGKFVDHRIGPGTF
jgi:hypothetical protein